MPPTFAVSDAVELAVIERSGFIESRHAGVAIVLGPGGEAVTELGNVSRAVLPRSSLKPVQALACVTAGAQLDGERLALATASHSGTDRHVAVVRDILDAAGLTEADLGCPPALPGDRDTRDELVRELVGPSRIRMNCSGKHAAMLLACTANGWDRDTYLDPTHPLQMHIRELVERLAGERVAAEAVDGCGAPIWALSLAGLARAIHRIGTSAANSPFALHRGAAALVQAVRENPWTIDGPGRPDSVVIETLGVFAKHGAEGVMVMVAPNGTTVALKVLDGSGRAAAAIAVRLLENAGALSVSDASAVMSELSLSLLGGERIVGAIRPTV